MELKTNSLLGEFVEFINTESSVDELYIKYLELEAKGLEHEIIHCPNQEFKTYINEIKNIDKLLEFDLLYLEETGNSMSLFRRVRGTIECLEIEKQEETWKSSNCEMSFLPYFDFDEYIYDKI